MIRLNDNIKCPTCSKPADAATGIDHEKNPNPGDIAICFYCGSVNIYYWENDQLILIKAPKSKMQDLQINHPDTYRMINAYVAEIKKDLQ